MEPEQAPVEEENKPLPPHFFVGKEQDSITNDMNPIIQPSTTTDEEQKKHVTSLDPSLNRLCRNSNSLPFRKGSLALDAFPYSPTTTEDDDSKQQEDTFKIPCWIVWNVLTLALVACGMFLVGQTTPMWGLGASINLTFTEASGQAPISKSYEPYEMSLFFSIKACIETGLVAEVLLGVILFFFSGVWPHVKIGLMLYGWFGRINHRFRHIMLYWVDSIGKFSFADPLLVVCLMAAFTVGVELHSGDFLFQTIATIVLKLEGLDDGTVSTDDIESIQIKLDIVAFYGIYFFCLGVWLSLILGTVVEHYNVRLLLLITHDDVLLRTEKQCLTTNQTDVNNGDGSATNKQSDNNSKNISQGGDVAGTFRRKTKRSSAFVTLPILVLLIIAVIVPIFRRTINGVLPMLVSAFGWIPVSEPPSVIQQDLTFGDIFRFLATQEGNAIYIMIVTVAAFCMAAPIFRSIVLDLMWYLPSSSSSSSSSEGDGDGIINNEEKYRHKADMILSASNISSIFDAAAVWLFAVVLVHFEIGAISAQIDMPFCNEVAVGAQMLESLCPELDIIAGGVDAFWNSPIYEGAFDIFSKKYPGWNDTLQNIDVECDNVESNAEAFNLTECLDIEIDFLLGMWCLMVAVLLAYASSLFLTYPWSVEVFGRDNFEAPICYRPEGWFCCCCCVGASRDIALEGGDEYCNNDGQTGDTNENTTQNENNKRFEYSFSKSMAGCCWCCHKKRN